MTLTFDCDYHVHTIYSGHSGTEMFIPAVMARAAELGLRRVLIVEHVPETMTAASRTPAEWLSGRGDRTVIKAILSEVRPRRGQIPGVEFLVGAEVDADPERMDGSLMLADLADLDAVVAATHLLPGGEAFWFNPPETPEAERGELLDRWLAWIENVVANPKVNILAHPGAELAAAGLAGGFGEAFRSSFRPVLTAMAARETAFELNEALLRRLGDEELAGYAELVKLARKCGVRFTTGSDAHRGEHLGAFRKVPELAGRAELAAADFWHPELAASLA